MELLRTDGLFLDAYELYRIGADLISDDERDRRCILRARLIIICVTAY